MEKNEGMTRLNAEIRKCIEEKLETGYRKFIIFPYGEVGMTVKHILNSAYGIQETYILDNHLCRYNNSIQPLVHMENMESDRNEYAVLLSCTNSFIYKELRDSLLVYFMPEQIAELASMKIRSNYPKFHTEIGRHSYGPICRDHELVESIGAFCSFAPGTEVVINHEMRYITTSPIIYEGADGRGYSYDDRKDENWYIPGLQPIKEKVKNVKRVRIGNDVWLGANVIVANYANIGNGVIAGAGAVITKDVPDYAVVGGVPARIIKYRYTPKQIDALNKIAWWNWDDETIRKRYEDFYLPVEEFIKKYL